MCLASCLQPPAKTDVLQVWKKSKFLIKIVSMWSQHLDGVVVTSQGGGETIELLAPFVTSQLVICRRVNFNSEFYYDKNIK